MCWKVWTNWPDLASDKERDCVAVQYSWEILAMAICPTFPSFQLLQIYICCTQLKGRVSRGWFLAQEVRGQVSTPLPPCAVMKLQWTWKYWGVFIMKKIFYIRVGRLNVLIFNIMWASTVTVFLKVFFFTLKYHTSTVSSWKILNQIL